MATNANDALDAIQQAMRGERWSPDTLEAVAEIMRAAGYAVDDVDTDDTCTACERDSLDCSRDPCPAVIADREA